MYCSCILIALVCHLFCLFTSCIVIVFTLSEISNFRIIYLRVDNPRCDQTRTVKTRLVPPPRINSWTKRTDLTEESPSEESNKQQWRLSVILSSSHSLRHVGRPPPPSADMDAVVAAGPKPSTSHGMVTSGRRNAGRAIESGVQGRHLWQSGRHGRQVV